MPGGGAEADITGNQAVVGTSGYVIHRPDGGSGERQGWGRYQRGGERAGGGRGKGWRIGVGQEEDTKDGGNTLSTLKTLGTEYSDPLDSALGMEHQHPILSMLGGYGVNI